ncbi:hypothetical protein HK105_204476 [Polyrhizophydium stewartii]|uniref:Sugar phosphate isomerase/epimerase n=1 Tax=Polyrhizophydium stewartii TaxID=2732419 RepID=A0ABR4N972_9FUNG|nr:hypothetical protein HK105_003399 [Polyrhizophydium stewartii]
MATQGRPRVFRSLWGAAQPWEELLPALRAAGFAGVEASLADIGAPDTARFVRLLRASGLVWICGLYSSWTDYVGKWERLPPAQHLANLRAQIVALQAIPEPPIHINCHTGSDAFSIDESVELFVGVAALQRELALAVPLSHETHRGRSLYSPWVALEIVRRVPDLLVTLDVSHWHVVCERLLEPADIAAIIERTAHVHARVASPQQPQIPDPRDPDAAALVAAHDAIWRAAFERGVRPAGRPFATLTPEYGPPEDGYMPRIVHYQDGVKTTKTTVRQLDELIIDEGHRLVDMLLDTK